MGQQPVFFRNYKVTYSFLTGIKPEKSFFFLMKFFLLAFNCFKSPGFLMGSSMFGVSEVCFVLVLSLRIKNARCYVVALGVSCVRERGKLLFSIPMNILNAMSGYFSLINMTSKS